MLSSFLLTSHPFEFLETVKLIILPALLKLIILITDSFLILTLKRLQFQFILLLHHSESMTSTMLVCTYVILQRIEILTADQTSPLYISKSCSDLILVLCLTYPLFTG